MDDSSPEFKQFADQYNAGLLKSIARNTYRSNINYPAPLPFQGSDNLYAFAVTWLDNDKIPQYASLALQIPCNSPNIIETKSLIDYLYSFTNSKFATPTAVSKTIQQDLSKVTGGLVQIDLNPPELLHLNAHFQGICLDNLDITCTVFTPDSSLLQTSTPIVTETLWSDLLIIASESTEQLTGSICINYQGQQIDHNSLLQYLVSFTQYQGLAAQTVEHIFCDIFNKCQPKTLTIDAKFTRRTQLAATIIRSNTQFTVNTQRLFRQ